MKLTETLKGFTSIYEGDSSITVLLTIAFSVVAMWQIVHQHMVDTNLMAIILSGYGIIGGVNMTMVAKKMNIGGPAGDLIGAVSDLGQQAEASQTTVTAVQ